MENREVDMGGIIFRNQDGGHQREQYLKFHHRGVLATRYPNNDCLHKLGIFDGVDWLLRLSGLSFVCAQHHPTYPKLTLEFLSSFSYSTPSDDAMFLTGTASFHMFNTEYKEDESETVHHKVPATEY